MNRARESNPRHEACEILDFYEAMLDACPIEERTQLMTEARIIAQAFAGERGAEGLLGMADSLAAGGRDAEMDRVHAHKLAAALRRLAQNPWS